MHIMHTQAPTCTVTPRHTHTHTPEQIHTPTPRQTHTQNYASMHTYLHIPRLICMLLQLC